MKRALSLFLSLLAAVLACVLPGCGGGVGSGGSGLASGTVSGFGSVYVDGVEIEDAQSSNVVENADGSTTNVALKLGQRVRVQRDTAGAATQINVQAAVTGWAGGIDAAAGSLRAAGQTVTVNTSPAAGPVTVFGGGYLSLADVHTGDLIEVHGIAVARGSGQVLLASRVEKLATQATARVMGTVSRLDAASASFAINGLTVRYGAATLVPTGAAPADGLTVVAWGALGSGDAPTLTATRLRVLATPLGSPAAGSTLQASGVVSGWNATARTFNVQGMKVSLGTATVSPAGAVPADSTYVRVSGVLAADGTLAAASVQVRQDDLSDATAQVRLQGAIATLRNSVSFVVRDVAVDASGIDLAAACPGVMLAAGTFVDVTARLQGGTDVVKATALRCPGTGTLSAFAMTSEQGTATSVSMGSMSFMLTPASGGARTVRWTAQTAFKGVTAASLQGLALCVEGYVESGVLVAREIRSPGQSDADRFDPRNGQDAWDQYDNGYRPPRDGPGHDSDDSGHGGRSGRGESMLTRP